MVNKARQTLSMTSKASDANELLCDNTTTLLRLIMSIGQIFWKKLGSLDKIFSKKQFYLFPTKVIRISRWIKQGKQSWRWRVEPSATWIVGDLTIILSYKRNISIHTRQCRILQKWQLVNFETRQSHLTLNLFLPYFIFITWVVANQDMQHFITQSNVSKPGEVVCCSPEPVCD